jgi:hypothetical protein
MRHLYCIYGFSVERNLSKRLPWFSWSQMPFAWSAPLAQDTDARSVVAPHNMTFVGIIEVRRRSGSVAVARGFVVRGGGRRSG